MKAHVIDSDLPITEGIDRLANCGQRVAKAVAVFFFDGEFSRDDVVNSLLCCEQCMEYKPTKRYVYGIVNGQETK